MARLGGHGVVQLLERLVVGTGGDAGDGRACRACRRAGDQTELVERDVLATARRRCGAAPRPGSRGPRCAAAAPRSDSGLASRTACRRVVVGGQHELRRRRPRRRTGRSAPRRSPAPASASATTPPQPLRRGSGRGPRAAGARSTGCCRSRRSGRPPRRSPAPSTRSGRHVGGVTSTWSSAAAGLVDRAADGPQDARRRARAGSRRPRAGSGRVTSRRYAVARRRAVDVGDAGVGGAAAVLDEQVDGQLGGGRRQRRVDAALEALATPR